MSAKDIRNIVLLGHSGSGKTTLAESMLYLTGGTDRLGRIADGNTVCDYDPEEIRRQISISLAVAPVEYDSCKINVLDVPGGFDFAGEVAEAVQAADAAVIVCSAKAGMSVGAEKAWKYCEKNSLPRLLYISKTDEENSDYNAAFNTLRERFGKNIAPVVAPIWDESKKVIGIIDVLHKRAFEFGPGGGRVEIEVPENKLPVLDELYDALKESVAETSEEFMEKFFNGEDFTHEELVRGIHDGVASGAITPLVCCANDTLSGVDMLLDAVVSMLPSPNERRLEYCDGELLDYDENKPLKALVFKTVADPFVGKISVLKVVQGKLVPGASVVNATNGETIRVGKLLKLLGKKQEEVSEANAGDIVAVAKLEAATNDTLCAPESVAALEPTKFPEACYFRAVKLSDGGDEGKLSAAIRRLLEEDLTLKYVHDHETHQRMIGGLGDQHLDVAVAKLKSKFGMNVVMSEPKIAYREAIRKKVTIESKYKKQSGGHGQYGHVKIEFEPYGGDELLFEEKIFGGSVPKNFFPAVEKGLQEEILGNAEHGSLGGFPVVKLKATLVDGSYHPVDSSEMAFKTAASMAFKDCMKEAQPYLLEPVDSLKILVPDEKQGDVMSVLSKRRGSVLGMNAAGNGMTELIAEAPVAELSDFALTLRQITQGLGEFTSEFARYDMLPPGTEIKS